MTQAQEIRAPMPHGAVDDPAWHSDHMVDQADQDRKAEIDAVIDPVESYKQNAETRNLTLGQIKARDEENLRLVLAGSKEREFPNLEAALEWMQELIEKLMHHMGIKSFHKGNIPMAFANALTAIPGNLYRPGMDTTPVTKECVANGVRLEVRSTEQYQHGPQEVWKAGAYIYHKGEIAYFVSNPLGVRNRSAAGGRIIIPEAQPWKFVVKTNAPGIM